MIWLVEHETVSSISNSYVVRKSSSPGEWYLGGNYLQLNFRRIWRTNAIINIVQLHALEWNPGPYCIVHVELLSFSYLFIKHSFLITVQCNSNATYGEKNTSVWFAFSHSEAARKVTKLFVVVWNPVAGHPLDKRNSLKRLLIENK